MLCGNNVQNRYQTVPKSQLTFLIKTRMYKNSLPSTRLSDFVSLFASYDGVTRTAFTRAQRNGVRNERW